MLRSDRRAIGGALALALSVAFVGTSLQSASAEDPADAPVVEVMGDYPVAEFVDDAALLPPELIDALDRDVQLTGAEYLAQSEAAVQAVDVVASLEGAGVDVLGSNMDESTLVVNVASEADVALVESAGAVAVIGAPEEFVLPEGLEPQLSADLHDGQGYYWETASSGYRCSVGFNGFVTATGAKEFITAGHCTKDMASIVGSVYAVSPTVLPNTDIPSASYLSEIGLPVAGKTFFGTTGANIGYDIGRVSVSNPSATPKAAVLTWGGGAGAGLSSAPKIVTGKSAAINGSTLCKSGARTGWRCGPVVDVDEVVTIGGAGTVNSIVAQVCSLPGDSGGAAVVGTSAVGISSWTTLDSGPGSTCPSGTNFFAGSFPMVSASGGASVTLKYPEWQLLITVPSPTITSSTSANITELTGTVSGAPAGSQVRVFIDGSSTALATVGLTGSSWTVPLTSVPNGIHTVSAVTISNTPSGNSAPTSGTFRKGVTMTRLEGAGRYDTGIAVSEAAFPSGSVPVLYLTTGLNYPDALSAGPAATHLGGALLLIQPDSISPAIEQRIEELNPAKVIVLGSESSVSATAFNQVQDIVPNTVRLAGSGRYDTSRLITNGAFLNDTDPGGATTVLISDGRNFPDALSAGPAAASVDGPVIMVDGGLSSVPAETISLIQSLGATSIYVTGGTGSISAGIYAQLESLPGTIERFSGTSRYNTSQLINAEFFSPTEPKVLLATGANYPDALVGSSAAGTMGAPLYITPTACLDQGIFAELVRIKSTQVYLLGGTPSLSPAVANLTRC